MGCSPSVQDKNGLKTFNLKSHGVSALVINESEIRIVRKTWKILSNNMPTIGAKIFLEIFTRVPQIKQIFPFREVTGQAMLNDPHFKGHASRFMQAVGATVDNLHKLEEAMAPLLFGLGQQHINFTGFDVNYFDIFVPSIMAVWQSELGARFTPEVSQVWKRMFEFMIVKLKEGHSDAIGNKVEGEKEGTKA